MSIYAHQVITYKSQQNKRNILTRLKFINITYMIQIVVYSSYETMFGVTLQAQQKILKRRSYGRTQPQILLPYSLLSTYEPCIFQMYVNCIQNMSYERELRTIKKMISQVVISNSKTEITKTRLISNIIDSIWQYLTHMLGQLGRDRR